MAWCIMKIVEKYYKLREVADRLSLSKRTIWNWVRAGKIDAVQLPNGQIRISRKTLDRFLTKAEKDGSPDTKAS